MIKPDEQSEVVDLAAGVADRVDQQSEVEAHGVDSTAGVADRVDQQVETETSVVTLTPVAAAKICELLEQENDSSLGLRIFVAGGGCSGLQYGMTLDTWQEDDFVDVFDRTGQLLKLDEKQKKAPINPSEGFKTFIDSVSKDIVDKSTVGYSDSLMGAGFTVDNPNAVSSCGCGHSFKTAEDTGSQPRSCGCGH